MFNSKSAKGLLLAGALLGFVAGTSATTIPVYASDKKVHKVVVHVDQNDPKVMNMALNNVANLNRYYQKKGEKVTIEVVAYGPGLHMFRADTSPVRDRIEKMGLEITNLKFSGCGNTHRNMSKKAGKEIKVLDEVKVVPSGVVRIIELQEKGYAYVRP